jgi:hydrogenase/urease accessory protein HupE
MPANTSMMPMRYLFRALAITIGVASATAAHVTGSSTVDIRLVGPDSLTVTVSATQTDFVEATGRNFKLGSSEERRSSADAYQEKLAAYLRARIRLETDQGTPALSVLQWKPKGRGPGDGFDSASFFRERQIVTMGGGLPKNRAWLRVEVGMFPELGVQPVSEISLFWKDTLVRRVWLGPDASVRFPMAQDTLDALVREAGAQASGAAPRQGAIFPRFIGIGFNHILPHGLDHVLFVLGLFFFATRIGPLLTQITAFTAAHSLTLGLSLVGVIALPSRVVEPLIALSIAVVGLENIFTRRLRASRWLVVFGFGLIHGLGFAGALREFGLPEGGFWSALLGFNLGVELGQLTVVAAAYAITRWLWRKPWYSSRVAIPASAIISLVALYWTIQRIFFPGF